MMGNEQSGPSNSRSRSVSRARSPAGRPAANDDAPPPPPYSPVDMAPSPDLLTASNAANELRRSRSSIGRESTGPQLLVPDTSSHRRSNSASRAQPRSDPYYAGGFRVDLPDPASRNPFTNTTPITAPNPAQQAVASPRVGVQRRSTTEDLLDLLKKYNTVIVVDDSSSMAGRRWRETRAALAGLADTASKYDVDGVDVYFLNSPVVGANMKSAQAVEALFDSIDPDGITPTGEKLEILLLDYLLQIEEAQDRDRATPGGRGEALKAIKPVNFIVLTDGAPSDDPESVIITAAKRLDARHFPLSQVGIQFVQIGDDAAAVEALKELDDALAGAHGIRDMVDTTPYSPERGQLSARDIAKILLGGINRRVDKRGAT